MTIRIRLTKIEKKIEINHNHNHITIKFHTQVNVRE